MHHFSNSTWTFDRRCDFFPNETNRIDSGEVKMILVVCRHGQANDYQRLNTFQRQSKPTFSQTHKNKVAF